MHSRRKPLTNVVRISALAASVLLVGACRPLPTGAPRTQPPATTTPSSGVWINAQEIAGLPASGRAWDAMHSAAVKSWGSPTIADQNSNDDTDTLAGALVAQRTNDDALRAKVRSHLMALVANHPYDRVLALARQLPPYVIAADVVGLSPSQRTAFEGFLREARVHKMAGHSGGDDLVSTALLSPNNWGTMSRGALAATDVYLGDQAGLATVANTQNAWLGGSVANSLRYTSTNWHMGRMVGINAAGSTVSGHSVDGVLPEDQRRTGEFAWMPPAGSYPHEALQGAVVASVILDRAGALPFNAGNNALARAEHWLDATGNPAGGDDRNTPWLLAQYGHTPATSTATSPAKDMAWADWTAS